MYKEVTNTPDQEAANAKIIAEDKVLYEKALLQIPTDNIVDIIAGVLLTNKYSIITKASTNLGIEGDNVKNIISPHEGGYILIKWS